MILKIVEIPNEILRQKSKPVGKVDKKVKKLISDMQETLEAQKNPEGVGLAASQVGKALRLFVVSYKGEKRAVINPEVLEKAKPKTKTAKSEAKEMPLEGCLSLPQYYGPVKRAQRIKIKYLNEKGQEVTEEFKGFMAQIVAHELDHLEGKIFIDRVLEQKVPLYKYTKGDWEEVEI